jgi:hypothetical protein
MLIPIVNLIALIWFAVVEWPIQQELAELRGGRGHAGDRGQGQREAGSGSPLLVPEKPSAGPSVEDLSNQASNLDSEGEWEKALAIYEQLATRLQGQQYGEYARNCAREIREKIAQAKGG